MSNKFELSTVCKETLAVLLAVAFAATGCADAMNDPSASGGNLETKSQQLPAGASDNWGKAPEGLGSYSWDVVEVATDANDNVYVAGKLWPGDNLDFDPNAPEMVNPSGSGMDTFLVKLDASGNVEWQKRFGSPGTGSNAALIGHHPVALETVENSSSSANHVVLGVSRSNSGLGGGIGYHHGMIRQFKPDSNGTQVWSRVIGTVGTQSSATPALVDIAVGPDDQLIAVGHHTEEFTIVHKEDDMNDVNITPKYGGMESFVVAFDNYSDDDNRTYEWSFSLGGAGTNRIQDVAKDRASGDFAMIGTYTDEHHHHNGPSAPSVNPYDRGANVFVQTLNEQAMSLDTVSGTGKTHSNWPSNFIGKTGPEGNYVEFDANSRLYIAGSFQGKIADKTTGVSLISNGDDLTTKKDRPEDTDGYVIRYPDAQSLGDDDFAHQTGWYHDNNFYETEYIRGLAVGTDWFAIGGRVTDTPNEDQRKAVEGFVHVIDMSAPTAGLPTFVDDNTITYTYDEAPDARVDALAFDTSNRMIVGGTNFDLGYQLSGDSVQGGAGFFASYDIAASR